MATTDNSGVRGSGSQRKSGVHSAVNVQRPPQSTAQSAAAAQLKKGKSLLDASMIERRRKRMERGVLIGAVSFIAFVAFTIWYDNGRIFEAGMSALRSLAGEDSFSSSSAIENCQNPKNRNTPYCQDRIAETEQTWNSIVKHDKKSPAFTLHGR